MEVALYAAFEAMMVLGSLRIVFFVHRKHPLGRAEFAISLVSLSVILPSSIALALSFAGYNGALQYMLAVALVAAGLHVADRRSLPEYRGFLRAFGDSLAGAASSWKTVCIFAVLVPLLLWQLQPFSGTDSVNAISYMGDWVSNETNPYLFQSYYVAFWELSFLPSMSITGGASMFWASSIKVLVMVFAAVWLLARTLNLSSSMSLLLAVNSVLFISMWTAGSGIGSIKTDSLLVAGVLMVAAAALCSHRGGRIGPPQMLVLFLGLAFMATKYSGVPMAAVFGAAFLALNWRLVAPATKMHGKVLVACVIILLGTSGHYYIYHVLEFGSPFYPLESGALYGTTLASSLADPLLYEIMLTAYKGDLVIWTLAVMVAGLACAAAVFVLAKRAGQEWFSLSFLAAFTVAVSAIVVHLPYGAHAVPGDYAYIQYLGGLRYLYPALVLSEILLLASFWKAGAPAWAISAAVASSALARLVGLYWSVPQGQFDHWYILYAVASAAALALSLKLAKWRPFRLLAVPAVLVCVLVASPAYVESNVEYSFWWWKESVSELYGSEPSTVVQIPSPDGDFPVTPLYHPLSGSSGQNTLVFMPRENLDAFMDDPASWHGRTVEYEDSIEIPRQHRVRTDQISQYPEYVVQLTNPNLPDQASLDETAKILSAYGYKVLVSDERQLLMHR